MNPKFLLIRLLYFIVLLIPSSGMCDFPIKIQYVFGGQKERIKNMRAENVFDSPIQVDLAKAAAKGDTNRIDNLIKVGADVNYRGRHGMRPLFWALINKNARGVCGLLENGADPNAVVEANGPPSDNALTIAVVMDQPDCLQALLLKGADPNASLAGGITPIFRAMFERKTNSISLLLNHGAEIDWQDRVGSTPLTDAVMRGSFEMALFLYLAGADPTKKNDVGSNAINLMLRFGNRAALSRRADEKAYEKLITRLRADGFIK